MNEKTTELIEKLAAKLGTTAEHLWEVLVNQAPIYAASKGTMVVLMAVVCAVLAVKCVRHIKRAFSAEGEDETNRNALSAMICGLSLAVLATISFTNVDLSLIMAGFFNPEYWALNEVLRRL